MYQREVPVHWREFQEETAQIFLAAGCSAEVDATVNGVRGRHKVDVYVTFKKYGIDCSWIIECKDWNSNIPKEKVAALQSIVNDVGADRGVVVSNKGFQSGAVRLANKSNITLASLEDMKEYLGEEISKNEVEFLQDQVTRLKYAILDINKPAEKSTQGQITKFTISSNGINALDFLGRLCVMDMGFDKLKLNKSGLPVGHLLESGKMASTHSTKDFLASVKALVNETSRFLEEVKSAET